MITSLVVAASRNDVIGRAGTLPWHLPEDLRHFRRLTLGHAAVAGRVTHESILARLGHPLPGRISVVVSSHRPIAPGDGVHWADSVDSAIALARRLEPDAADAEVFVIGGASVYEQALPLAEKIWLTRIDCEIDGDASMPPGWLDGFHLVAADDRPGTADGFSYSFLEYLREPS